MNNYKISVIIPVYNSADILKETINSVINQSYQNIEILVVNDCSTDNVLDILHEFSVEDIRIKVINLKENGGVAVARNVGIENATGDYIAFLDSDDSWAFDKLEKQLSFMLENDYKFSYTSYVRINDEEEQKNIIAPVSVDYSKLLTGNFIGCSTVMVSSGVIDDLSFPLLRKRQDYALWLKILRTGINAYGLNEILMNYRVHSKSLSGNKLKLIKYQWQLFRDVEEMNVVKAFYYFSRSIITSFIK